MKKLLITAAITTYKRNPHMVCKAVKVFLARRMKIDCVDECLVRYYIHDEEQIALVAGLMQINENIIKTNT